MARRIQTLVEHSRGDAGASAVEYALLVIAIALTMVIGAFLLGDALSDRFDSSATCVQGNSLAACP